MEETHANKQSTDYNTVMISSGSTCQISNSKEELTKVIKVARSVLIRDQKKIKADLKGDRIIVRK